MGCEYGLDDGDECRAYGSWRIGLEGAERDGLWLPSLSLDALLGGVGGNINESMLTEEKTKIIVTNNYLLGHYNTFRTEEMDDLKHSPTIQNLIG